VSRQVFQRRSRRQPGVIAGVIIDVLLGCDAAPVRGGAHRWALFAGIYDGGDGRRTARECAGAVGVALATIRMSATGGGADRQRAAGAGIGRQHWLREAPAMLLGCGLAPALTALTMPAAGRVARCLLQTRQVLLPIDSDRGIAVRAGYFKRNDPRRATFLEQRGDCFEHQRFETRRGV